MLSRRDWKTIAIILALSSAIIIYGLFIVTLIGVPISSRLRIVPDDYRSIQEAVNEALDGDIIYVKVGIYQENLVINKPLIFVGEDPRRTLLDGGASDYTILIKVGGMIITGFTITGGGTMIGVGGRGAGLQIYNSSHVLVLRNHFTGNRMAIYIHSSSDILIAENLIHGNREGIYLTGSSRVTISENILMENPNFGIHLTSSKENKISRNTIIGGVNGIYLYSGADENEVAENIIKGGGMLILDSSSNRIMDNVFADKGIFFSNSYANTISGNKVNGEPIVYLEMASGEVVERAGQVILINCENITLMGISASGVGVAIELWNTNNSQLIESELLDNEIAIYIHSSSNNKILRDVITSNSIGVLLSSSHNNVVSDNALASNLFGIALRDSQDNTINNNLISGSLNAGILLLNSSRNIIGENTFINNSRDLIGMSP
jgi:parallel beta-helix repeat protein